MPTTSFLKKYGWSILSQLLTVIIAVSGFAWVASAQVHHVSTTLESLGSRIDKIETTLDNMHTLDLRVTRLEQGLIKTGDVLSRLERAVVRLEALAERPE
tara:strand:+ start:118 stop:417 length:300 start_codon:yes stop_codon:yes gene_type:complete